MKLFDLYKSKLDDQMILIDSFAVRVGTISEDMVVVFRKIIRSGFELGSIPSFNGYGTAEEIEELYEFYAEYKSNKWNEWMDS